MLIDKILALIGIVVMIGLFTGVGAGPEKRANVDTEFTMSDEMKEATFGAGCFWGVEAAFGQVEGVESTEVGFMGGHVDNPSYKQVCAGGTGHAEVVHLAYDPEQVSYEELLEAFFEVHDPTQRNRQGPDVGYQYRSVIFYYDEAQREAAEAEVAELEETGRFSRPTATAVEPAQEFWRAEEYHQKYHEKHGRSCRVL